MDKEVVTEVASAKIAEQLERFEPMAEHMKKAAQLKKSTIDSGEVFTPEERNLFSVAYKNVIGTRRSSYRQASALEERIKDDDPNRDIDAPILKSMKNLILEELTKICDEVLAIIDDNLLIDGNSDQTKVFYQKMKGDYCRYIAEAVDSKSEKHKEYVEKASENYTSAQDIAKNMESTDPIRLGLALNFSVFHYEIKKDPNKACSLAKTAFDEAMGDLEKLKEESYKDSTLIMQLLRDNLTLWTTDGAEMDSEGDGKGDGEGDDEEK